MGGSFWGPGPQKLTFVESKGCQFLFILSMGQDGVFQKILTSPISKTDIFLGHPVFNSTFISYIAVKIYALVLFNLHSSSKSAK